VSSVLSLFLVIATQIVVILSFREILKGENLEILCEGNRITSKIGKYWSVLVMIRWNFVTLILVLLRNHSDFQIIANFGFSILF